MNPWINARLCVALVILVGVSGCGKSDTTNDLASEADSLTDDCNKTLLAALPEPNSVTVAQYVDTNCTYNLATRFWQKGELQLSVQITDAKVELPAELNILGMGEMITQANNLTFEFAKGIVSGTKESITQMLENPDSVESFGDMNYLPVILKTPTQDEAVVSFSQYSGAGPLYAVINDRYVVTIERSDASEFPDNSAIKHAYQPLLDSINYTLLR